MSCPVVNLETVTLYHLTDEDKGVYARTVYSGTVYKQDAAAPEKGGFKRKNGYKIRIPGADAIAVDTADYVYIGEGPQNPVTADCFKVCRVWDNRRGSLPHYRIEAV